MKIGMHIALRLLRDGAHTTITTRFPKDAARRFAAMPDAAEWTHRLVIVAIDLRYPAQVLRLADMVANAGHLDILIQNAAQTLRRSATAYSPLVDGERAELTGAARSITIRHLGMFTPHLIPPHSLIAIDETQSPPANTCAINATPLDALTANPGPPALGQLDAGGLLPDSATSNTWNTPIGQIPPLEILEVNLCNATAPMLLLNALRPALSASPFPRKYVVNVTAAEGQFDHRKTPFHPHTNMAKAGLNMLTRTVAGDLYRDHVLVTSVDTGWVTDERVFGDRTKAWEDGYRTPLDLEDGASRVYDPIVRGEAGEDLYGVLLVHYQVAKW